MHVAARLFMPGRRARKPEVSGALAKVLLERDRGCSWCGKTCDSSAASIEYRNPASRDSDASIDSDDLIAVCELCTQTEKRSVRFPRGLLVAADKIDGTGFSETVRVALIEYLERRNARGNVPPRPNLSWVEDGSEWSLEVKKRVEKKSALIEEAIKNMEEIDTEIQKMRGLSKMRHIPRHDCPNCGGVIVADTKEHPHSIVNPILKCEQCGFVLDGIRRVWS